MPGETDTLISIARDAAGFGFISFLAWRIFAKNTRVKRLHEKLRKAASVDDCPTVIDTVDEIIGKVTPEAKYNTRLEFVQDCREKGRYELALSILMRTHADYPSKTSVPLEIGQVYHEAGEYRKALVWYARAMKMGHERTECLYSMGVTQYYRDRYAMSVTLFTKVIDNTPDYFDALMFRAYARKECGDIEGAKADFDRASALAPDSPRAFYGRGRMFADEEMNEEAVADFTAAIRLDPGNYHAYIGRGVCLCRMKRYNEALDDLCFLAERNIVNGDILYFRSEAYLNTGKYREAITDCTEFINNAEEQNVDVYYNRAVARSYIGDYHSALADFSRAIDCATEPVPWILYRRGGIHYHLEMFDKALADLDAAIYLDAKNEYFWLQRGKVMLYLENFHNAHSDLTRALDLNPLLHEALYSRAFACAKLDHPGDALRDASLSITLSPSDADYYRRRAWIYSLLGDSQNETADLSRATLLELASSHIPDHDENGIP